MSTVKSSFLRVFAAFAAVGIICLQADAAVIDGSVFRYQMSIKPASGMVTTTLANFPVLVRLSAEKLENFVPAQCGENGANLRFALADGTLLAHEIDCWNTNGESTVWVNVPSLTNGTEIVAYWSLKNGKTAPAVTASDTWPNFVAVYHFSEETGAISDSSANHYASTNALGTVSNTTAKVGLSRNMANDRFRTGVTNLLSSSAAKPITTVSKFTVSGWMKETTGVSAGYRTLFNKGGSSVGWYQNTQNNLTQMTASGSGTTRTATTIPSGASIYSQWCYFIMAYDGGTVYHYINGSSLGGKSVSAVTANTTYELSVSGSLTGMIDEMRIQDGVVSSAWAAADYANQATTTFLDYGEVTAKNPPFTIEAIPTQIYLGAALEPAVVVKDVGDGHVLTNGTDYTVSFDLNDGPGNGRVTVTGVPDTAYADGLLNASFKIVNGPWHVTDYSLGTEGHGFSWGSPVSLSNAVARALAGDTILCKAGEYIPTKQVVISQPIIIKGGYAGTDDSALDPVDPVTTLNATNNTAFQSMVSVTTATGAGTSNHFERLCFMRGYVRGLNKSGAADISFKDCRFYRNGYTYNPGVGYNGVGANLSGTSAVEARFANCLFDNNAWVTYPGNRNTCMQGAGFYSAGFKRVYVDNCSFLTNCAAFDISGEYGQDKGEGGGAIWADSQPITIRSSCFIANRTPNAGTRGAAVRITGSSGGSAVSNSVFIANQGSKSNSAGSSIGAALSASMTSGSDTIDVEGCTFAYNVAAATTTAAGFTIAVGTAKVRNTIFYGNQCNGVAAHYGVDINTTGSSAYLDIDYSLVTGSSDAYISCFKAANFTLGEHMVYGDPLFGTTLANANACKSGGYFYLSKLPTILAFNLHEGALGTGYSRAIDTGDPAKSVGSEPAPNGGRVNLGFYGGTAEAAASVALNAPALASGDITIEFASDTKPTVTTTLGGETNFNATVKIEIATNDFQQAATAHESAARGGLQLGESLTLAAADLYRPGTTLYVKVTVTAAGSDPIVVYKSALVTGTLPYYYGHSGGEGVIHVREGASGLKTGLNWTDAFDSMNDAVNALDSTKTNIWICGKITQTMAGVSKTISAPLQVLGGFRGDEDSPDERDAGTYATLDGANAYSLPYCSNAAANPLYFERVIFTRAGQYAFQKSGNGPLAVYDCKFLGNLSPQGDVTGRGCNLSGGGRVAFTNCEWRGNMKTATGSSLAQGSAIYASGLNRLILENCLFVTNGMSPVGGIGESSPGRDQCNGDGLWIKDTPVTANNCHFRGNRGGIRGSSAPGTGGVFLFDGACGGSAFTNCAFVGNWDTYSSSDLATQVATRGGALVFSLSTTASAVDFERCTIAYNLGDSRFCPGGIEIEKGTVNMHNSIIFGNRRGQLASVGHDIHVFSSGRLNLSYCRLTEEDETTSGKPSTNSVSEASAGLVTYANLSFGDPAFSTPYNDVNDSRSFMKRVKTGSGSYTYYTYLDNSAAGAAYLANIDAHLLSKQGYWDNAGVFHDDTKVVSTCIDAGDRASDYTNEPKPNGHRVNLGAYGNTPYASMTPVTGSLIFIK